MEILLSELISGKDLPDILLRGISADSREIKKANFRKPDRPKTRG